MPGTAICARDTASNSSERLLGGDFAIEQVATYSRAFSELVDTLLNGLYLLLQRRKTSGPASRRRERW